ncbi:uncharacterized protein V2V93DRAFT_128768 [Kockiozyma suomiensis]|uniref:uncharacterized protein n=1 Tax=Kockiozyma suomiensis TaxID=1337062 RepID=UPI0033437797
MMLTAKRNLIFLTSAATACLVLTLLGVMQLTKAAHFHLPLPDFYPVMAMILPSATLLLLVLPIASKQVFTEQRMFYPAILIGLVVVSSLFIALLTPYLNSLSMCVHETAWKAMYDSQDARIEKIETALKCCGFNSVYDRSAPFVTTPDSIANACVLKYHYNESCSTKWEHETSVAAEWCVTVFAFILIGNVISLIHTVLIYKKYALAAGGLNAAIKSAQQTSHSRQSSGYASIISDSPLLTNEQSGLLEEQSATSRQTSSSLDLS